MSDQTFDLSKAILDNSQFQPVASISIPQARAPRAPTARRPSVVRGARRQADSRPTPTTPLLKDKNFVRYQFAGAIASMVVLEAILLFILYLNVRFSVRFLATANMAIGTALVIQVVVSICEQHLPRLKRFFLRVQLHELWRVVRWVVWPLLFLATFFDVYTAAAGLRLEVVQRFLTTATAQDLATFTSHPLWNTLWTVLGGGIAIIPEPLLIITSVAIVRLLKDHRRALAWKA